MTRQAKQRALAILLAFAGLSARKAHASVALLMEDPYGHLGTWSPTGHAAIYLDHVCAVSAVELRRCTQGEQGVVISRYHAVLKDDWLAIGVVPYLFAVDDIKDAPTTLSSRAAEETLRDRYWREHLADVIPSSSGKPPSGNWTQLIGSSFDRTVHIFEVNTTTEQDDKFIREFNARRNKSHFNFFFHNCADFSRVVLNMYFPGAIRRNDVADFGLMTPKQAAHSLIKYSRSHPEVALRQYEVPQVSGGIARSHRIRGVSESLLKTKRWLVPLLIVEPQVIGVSAIAYYTTGRITFEHSAPPFPLLADR